MSLCRVLLSWDYLPAAKSARAIRPISESGYAIILKYLWYSILVGMNLHFYEFALVVLLFRTELIPAAKSARAIRTIFGSGYAVLKHLLYFRLVTE